MSNFCVKLSCWPFSAVFTFINVSALEQMGYRFSPTMIGNLLAKFDPRGRYFSARGEGKREEMRQRYNRSHDDFCCKVLNTVGLFCLHTFLFSVLQAED